LIFVKDFFSVNVEVIDLLKIKLFKNKIGNKDYNRTVDKRDSDVKIWNNY